MNRRKEREACKALDYGQYHFCTDGWAEGRIFNSISQFAFGMILMGLLCLRYNIKIYAFTLMPNHIHIILSGSGDDCLRVFDYLKRKLSARLRRDGYPPLPADYWFKLTRIETPEQLRHEIIYVLRNPLEKSLGIVGCYLWSSAWVYYPGISELLSSASTFKPSTRELRKLVGGDDSVPDNWRLHPYLGLHPGFFVDIALVQELFPKAKDLQTALVKDYEVFFQIASRLGELCEFSKAEQENIVSQTLQKRFPGQRLNTMTEQDKGKLAIILHREFGFNSYQISTNIYIKERVVRQLLGSKELR